MHAVREMSAIFAHSRMGARFACRFACPMAGWLGPTAAAFRSARFDRLDEPWYPSAPTGNNSAGLLSVPSFELISQLPFLPGRAMRPGPVRKFAIYCLI
jgi:hypothetical protein